jgi:predicted RNA binding protein YcfA (HicA-like mRNA interferase family)
MPKLKRLTAKELLAILASFGFVIASQKGSHIKLVRQLVNEKQVLTIPNHSSLDTGTCKAILRQASRYISLAELSLHFYCD